MTVLHLTSNKRAACLQVWVLKKTDVEGHMARVIEHCGLAKMNRSNRSDLLKNTHMYRLRLISKSKRVDPIGRRREPVELPWLVVPPSFSPKSLLGMGRFTQMLLHEVHVKCTKWTQSKLRGAAKWSPATSHWRMLRGMLKVRSIWCFLLAS